MEENVRLKFIIPNICGRPYDKYDSFKECISALDSKMVGNEE